MYPPPPPPYQHPGYPPQPQAPYPYAYGPPQPQVTVMIVPKSPSTAALLEVLPGLFQVFGIGHIYAGQVGGGIALMVGYWITCAVNACLVGVGIGLFTWPLTWLVFMIGCGIGAHSSAAKSNARHGIHWVA